jgi:serine/threonine-protein kinase
LCEAIDTRTDVYALGILLFQILTGTLPFTGSRGDVAGMHLHAKRPRPSERAPVPPALDALVLRAIERKRDKRYQSVKAFLDEFRRAVRGDEATGAIDADRTAVGICMEVRTQEDDVDDAMLDDMTNILDSCEAALRAAGFAVAVQTSNVLLGVKPLSNELAKQRVECGELRELASTLLERLVGRDFADPRVHANVGIHLAGGVFREAADGLEVTGGPILQIEEWVPQRDLDELFVSDAFQRGVA